MKLEQSFEVAAPVERVWATLIDVEAVAPCLPGAEITGADDDGAYRGTFSVKLGPASAAYAGSLRLEQVDDASRTIVMRAEGSDKRGQGAAKATIESTVSESGDVTRVAVVTDFTITGRLARFGRGGLMEDIANRLMRDFASCLEARIGAGAGPTAAAADPAAPADRVGVGASTDSSPAETDELLDRVAESAATEPTAASPEEAGSLTPAREPANARTEPPTAAGPASPAARSGTAASPAGRPSTGRPLKSGSLVAGILRDRIARFFRRLLRRS